MQHSILLAATTTSDTIRGKLKNIGEIGAGYSGASGDSSVALADMAGRIVRIGLGVSGIVFFALIAYAGYVWLQAGGKDEDVKKALRIFQTASIGLTLTILAGAITQFALFYAQQ